MTKQSGQAEAAPQEDKIELQIMEMMVEALTKNSEIQQKILERLETSVTVSGKLTQPPKTDKEKEIDKINRERLARFRDDKIRLQEEALAEQKRREG